MPAQFIPLQINAQDIRTVALLKSGRYSFPVAAKSATGCRNPQRYRRTSAQFTIAGAFFVPAFSRYGGLRRSTLGCAGLLVRRSANPVQSATLICLAADGGGPSVQGSPRMKHALNPFKNRAAAHRAMALAALHANSSLATRLARYNAHMSKARALESVGGAQ